MALKLEVGKKYIDRTGNVVRITRSYGTNKNLFDGVVVISAEPPKGKRKWRAEIDSASFADLWSYHSGGNWGEECYRLIAEYEADIDYGVES